MLVYQRVFSIDGLHWEDFLPGQSTVAAFWMSQMEPQSLHNLKRCSAKKIGKYMIQVQPSWFSTFLFPFQNQKKGLILTGRAWLFCLGFMIHSREKKYHHPEAKELVIHPKFPNSMGRQFELMIWVSFRQDFSKSHSAAIFWWGLFGAQECSACQNLLESKIKACGQGSVHCGNRIPSSNSRFFGSDWELPHESEKWLLLKNR